MLVKLMAPPLVTWPWPAPAWIEGEQSAANEPLPLASVVSRFIPSEVLIPLKDDPVNLPEPMTNFELACNEEMSAESDGSVDVSASEEIKGTGLERASLYLARDQVDLLNRQLARPTRRGRPLGVLLRFACHAG